MVPPCSDRITRVPPYSSSVLGLRFRIRGYHPLWPAFPDRSANARRLTPTGLFPFRSPLLRESRLISFLWLLRCFNSPGSLQTPMNLVFGTDCSVGFPIRTSPDQSSFASSPKLFAGYHVLLRLSLPRHPPHALSHLTLLSLTLVRHCGVT